MQLFTRLFLAIYLAFALLGQVGVNASIGELLYQAEEEPMACCMALEDEEGEDEAPLPACCTPEGGCKATGERTIVSYTVSQVLIHAGQKVLASKASSIPSVEWVPSDWAASLARIVWEANSYTSNGKDIYLRTNRLRT